jgi:hypothetical protein
LSFSPFFFSKKIKQKIIKNIHRLVYNFFDFISCLPKEQNPRKHAVESAQIPKQKIRKTGFPTKW